jgi:histidinol-phosphatase (PHP family)
MKTNYHTHHELCGHAIGNCDDYCKEAVKNDFTELGFSDHAPNPNMDDIGVRMRPYEIDQYLKEINDSKVKYKDNLKIYTGLEVEYFYNHEEYLQELSEITDYLILGQHYISFTKDLNGLISGFGLTTKDQIELYADYVIEGMKTGHFVMLAHPDLYMHCYIEWDETAQRVARRIIETAMETNTILEFNANGFRRPKKKSKEGMVYTYPNRNFFKLVKEYNVEVMISSDCHTPEQLNDRAIIKAEEVVQELGLKLRKNLFENV